MWRWISLGLALGVGLGLAGCTQPTPYKYRIALIPKGLTHEFWQAIHRGGERAAADLERDKGIRTEIVWDGPLKENDALAQIRIVDRRISTHVNGIILAPQHSTTMVPPVERAVHQGIPVVIIDSGLENQDIIVKYVATNNYNGGRLAALYLLDTVLKDNPAPRLVLLRYQVGSQSTDQREMGFEDVVDRRIKDQQRAGKPTITWLSRDQYAGATKDTAIRQAAPLLNKLRDKGIDAVFAPNESSANGVLVALRSLGMSLGSPGQGKKVHLMGFDSSEPLLEAVCKGDVDGLVVQDPYKMGYLSVWTMVRNLEGEDVAANGKAISTGEHVIKSTDVLRKETGHLGEEDLRQSFDDATRKLFDPAIQSLRSEGDLQQGEPYLRPEDFK